MLETDECAAWFYISVMDVNRAEEKWLKYVTEQGTGQAEIECVAEVVLRVD